MREGLRLPGAADETLHGDLAALADRVAGAGGGVAELAIANGLFVQIGAELEAAFKEIGDRHYRGTFHDVDFRSATEAARIAINRWVADRTRGRIDNLIREGGLAPETRLVVANAVYFKCVWDEPFLPFATFDEPFFLDGGGKVTVPLMRLVGERVRYARSAGFEVAEIDYRGGEMSMLILLPERKDGLPDLESRLSAELLDECVGRLVQQEVMVRLPRFELTWEEELGDVLRAMGLRRAFDRSRADLSGINGLAPPHRDALFISDVIHKAFVNVREEGTEAAAATVIEAVIASAGMPGESSIPIFRADHPFLFAIRHRASGALLFLGRVEDPTSEG
jgi:serpin B